MATLRACWNFNSDLVDNQNGNVASLGLCEWASTPGGIADGSSWGKGLSLPFGAYASIPYHSSLAVGDDFTLSVWVKPARLDLRHPVYSDREPTATGFPFMLEIGVGNGRSAAVGVTSTGTWVAQTASDVLTVDEWNHIVYRKSGSSQSIMVNGVLRTLEINSPVTFTNSEVTRWFGARGSDTLVNTLMFDGLIDEVRLYVGQLNDGESLNLFLCNEAYFRTPVISMVSE